MPSGQALTIDRVRGAAPWTIAIIWAALGLATVAMAIVVAYSGAISAPYWDEWGYTDPAAYLQELFKKHNEHPFALGRLFAALDYSLFDARGWALQTLIFLILALQAAAFVWLGRLAGLRRTTLIGFGGVTCIALFGAHGWQNLIWGFQVSFVLVFAAATGTFAALAAYAAGRSRAALALALFCAVLAPQALANGMFVPALATLMAWRLKLGAQLIAAFAGITIFSVICFALMPSDIAGSAAHAGLGDIPALLSFFFTYLGGPIVSELSYLFKSIGAEFGGGVSLAQVWGAAIFVLTAMLCGVAFFKSTNPAWIAASIIAAFGLATAGVTALGRFEAFAGEAMAPRYAACVAMIYVSALYLLIVAAPAPLRRYFTPLAALVVPLGLIAPIAALSWAQDLAGQQRERLAAQTALVMNLHDAYSIDAIAYDVPGALQRSQVLRQHAKSLFKDRWSRTAGEGIDTSAADAHICARGEATLGASGGGIAHFSGAVSAREAQHGGIVVVTGPAGLMLGYGLVVRDPADLLRPFPGRNRTRDFQGHIDLAHAEGDLTFYLASQTALLCRIGVAAPPSAGAPS